MAKKLTAVLTACVISVCSIFQAGVLADEAADTRINVLDEPGSSVSTNAFVHKSYAEFSFPEGTDGVSVVFSIAWERTGDIEIYGKADDGEYQLLIPRTRYAFAVSGDHASTEAIDLPGGMNSIKIAFCGNSAENFPQIHEIDFYKDSTELVYGEDVIFVTSEPYANNGAFGDGLYTGFGNKIWTGNNFVPDDKTFYIYNNGKYLIDEIVLESSNEINGVIEVKADGKVVYEEQEATIVKGENLFNLTFEPVRATIFEVTVKKVDHPDFKRAPQINGVKCLGTKIDGVDWYDGLDITSEAMFSSSTPSASGRLGKITDGDLSPSGNLFIDDFSTVASQNLTVSFAEKTAVDRIELYTPAWGGRTQTIEIAAEDMNLEAPIAFYPYDADGDGVSDCDRGVINFNAKEFESATLNFKDNSDAALPQLFEIKIYETEKLSVQDIYTHNITEQIKLAGSYKANQMSTHANKLFDGQNVDQNNIWWVDGVTEQSPAVVALDLGECYALDSLVINYPWGERTQDMEVWASSELQSDYGYIPNNMSFKKILDNQTYAMENGINDKGITLDLSSETARYIWLVITGNSSGSAQVGELNVLVKDSMGKYKDLVNVPQSNNLQVVTVDSETGNSVKGQMISAYYKNGGFLTKAEVLGDYSLSGEKYEYNFSPVLNVPEGSDNVSLFVWDSIDNMRPLTNAY